MNIPSSLRGLARKFIHLGFCALIVAALSGCASTKETSRERLVYDKLPKPDRILVYNFSPSAADAPADSAYAGQAPAGTAEQLALGHRLGTAIAARLVEEIQQMGLPATQVSAATPQLNDIVIRGYLVSIDKGSTAKRMTIGFGAGGSELTTAVEGYQMTATGLRKLGSGVLDSKGSKGPGATLGAAGWLVSGSPVGLVVSGGMKIYGEASGSATVDGRAKETAKEIGEVIKGRFKEEGWIR